MERISIEDTGYWLVINAHNAWYVEDIVTARNLLNQVSDVYWNKYFHKHLQEDESFRQAVSDLVEEFGVTDFRLLRDKGIQA